MAKCGLCGKDCEDFTKTKESVFICDTPMCRECYDKFLSKHFKEIINLIIRSVVPIQNVDLMQEIFDDFDVYDNLYTILAPTPLEPMSVIKIAEDKEK